MAVARQCPGRRPRRAASVVAILLALIFSICSAHDSLAPRQLVPPSMPLSRGESFVALWFSVAHVHTNAFNSRQARICSGVLLSPRLALTAASCLYWPKDPTRNVYRSTWVNDLSVIPGKSTTRWPFGFGRLLAMHVPSAFLNAAKNCYTKAAADHNYALVSVQPGINDKIRFLGRDSSVFFGTGAP